MRGKDVIPLLIQSSRKLTPSKISYKNKLNLLMNIQLDAKSWPYGLEKDKLWRD